LSAGSRESVFSGQSGLTEGAWAAAALGIVLVAAVAFFRVTSAVDRSIECAHLIEQLPRFNTGAAG